MSIGCNKIDGLPIEENVYKKRFLIVDLHIPAVLTTYFVKCRSNLSQ